MKKLSSITNKIIVLSLVGFLCSSFGFAQSSSDYKVLEKDYDNSGILFYVKPHPSWSEASIIELPNILSEIYKVPKGWELVGKDTLVFERGRAIRVNQAFNGVLVDGGDMTLRYNLKGELTDILGTPRTIDMTPPIGLISPEQVLESVYDDLGVNALALDVDPSTGQAYEPQITFKYAPYNSDLKSEYKLCYEVEIILMLPARYFYFINAANGEIADKQNALFDEKIKGTSVYSGSNLPFEAKKVGSVYHSHDETRKIRAFDYGLNVAVMDYAGPACGIAAAPVRPLFMDASSNWTDMNKNAAVDIMWGMAQTYDYFKQRHSRKSFDNNGATIDNRVYYDEFNGWNDRACPIDSAKINWKYNNAFWNGRNLSYGQGNGTTRGRYGSINTCGHEFTHAVVEKTAGLKYQGESGALNESFADMFGTAIEFFGKESIGLSGNWLYADEHTLNVSCLRNVKNPKDRGQPDTHGGTNWKDPTNLADDHGGVHRNSGVGNYWFYLVSEGSGGKKTNDKNDEYEVTGITMAKAEKIAYRALSAYMGNWSDYTACRKATKLACRDYWGDDSKEEQTVCDAWYAVGVGPKCCDTMELSFTIEEPTCADSRDGKVNLTIKKADGPFTYRWYENDTNNVIYSTSKNLVAAKAETYIVIVTDTVAKCEEVGDTTLEGATVKVTVTGGGVKSGPCDRAIPVTLTSKATGGVEPYTYNWSPGGVKNITLGGRSSSFTSYTAVITDDNGCKGKKTTSLLYIPIRCSYDPNDIIGPPAYGEEGWVAKSATLPYKIRYENDPKFATGPAQRVEIRHVLDSNVNVNSFRLKDFGFYTFNFQVPDNSISYSKRLDIRDSFDIYLDVLAGINRTTREAFWIFESIDPNTGLPPTSGSKGFLRVNDTTIHDGEGYVNYEIRPASHTVTGDSIRAIAKITFDQNPDINTPRIFNLVDAVAPTSSIDSIADILDSNAVTLTVTAQDDSGGSGVGTYDVYFSENGGASQLYLSEIEDSSFTFSGNFGSTYSLYARASDNVANREANKSKGDIEFTIRPDKFFKDLPSSTSLCSGDTLSIYWYLSSISSVDLEYTADSGATYTTFATDIGVADTQYHWVIPTSISGSKSYFVRALSPTGSVLDSTDVFVLNAGPVPDLGPDTSFCDGSSFSLTLDPGSGFSSYKWSNGSTTSTITATTHGDYEVEVSNSTGCYASDKITIAKTLLPMVMSKDSTDPSCFGDADGTASLVVVSGTAPYTYSWSNGASTASISGLSGGTYFVTIADTKGCISTESVKITDPTMMSSNTIVNHVKCNGGSDGSINLSVIGGNAPHSYLWSNSETSQNIATLIAGTYSVTITDSKSCTATKTTTITEPSVLSGSLSVTDVLCNAGNDGAIDLSISGGTPSYTYLWSNSATTQDVNALSAGTYLVTITDANSCVLIVRDQVTEPTALSTSITITHVSCNGGNDGAIGLSVSGGSPAYKYLWSNGATTQDLGSLSIGSVSVTVTDNHNCEIYDAATVTEPNALTISLSPTPVKCKDGNDGSISLTAGGGTQPYTYKWSNGATSQNLSALTDGVYSVTLTDNNSCSILASATITEPTAISGSLAVTDVLCNSGNDGAIDLSLSGGTPSYTYLWSNGMTNQDINGLTAATYTVTISDANSCVLILSDKVDEPTALSVSSTVTNVSCNSGNDGAIDLSVSGGSPAYKYLWSNGATTQDLGSLSQGSYSVTVTDDHNCTISDAATVTQPNALTISLSPTPVKCKDGNDGSISLTAGGGTLPYTYKWSNGATSQNLSALSDGIYSVTLTDKNLCTIISSTTVTEPTALSSSVVVKDVLCNGGNDGGATLTVSGGTPAYTYAWSNSTSNKDLSNVIAGTYTVVITDANGCTTANQAIVGEPTALTKSSTVTHVLCNGGNNASIDLTIGGGSVPYSYNWSTGATTQDVNSLVAGTYYVTVTDDHNCVILDTATIIQPTAIALTKSIDDVLCFAGNDGAVDISVSGGTPGYTFVWSNSANSEDINGLVSGTYIVEVTDANNCKLRDTSTVGQPAAPLAVTMTPDSVNCFNENTGAVSINVTGGTSGYTYRWNNGATTQNISNLFDGQYIVVISDANKCELIDTVDVFEPIILNGVLNGSDVLCFGGNSGEIDLIVSGGSGPFTYAWSNTANTQDLMGLSIGTYAVTITDKNACVFIDSAEIKQPLAAISSSVLETAVKCFNGNDGAVDLSVSGGTMPYRYSWSNGSTSQDINTLSSGQYEVLIIDFNNCTWRDTGIVSQPADPLNASIDISNVKCYGGNDGTATITMTGGTSPYFYNWSDGSNTNSISTKVTGSYYVTITDNNNCELLDTAFINQPSAPLSSTVSIADALCYGGNDGTIDLTVMGGTGPYNFAWSNGGTTEDINTLTTGSYDVLITDFNNCTLRDTGFVGQPTAPIAATFVVTDVKCFDGSDGSIDLTVTGGTGPYTFAWSTGSNGEDVNSLESQWHSVRITDNNNCILDDSAFVDEPPLLTTTTESTSATADGSNGSAWTIPLGGTAPYSYLWDDPMAQTDDTATGLVIGAYNVLITDNNGCTLSDSVWVPIAPDPSTIAMFPNPTNGVVKIVNLDALGLEEPIRIEVVQMQGKIEQSFDIIGMSEFDFALDPNLFNGMYLVHITNFRGTETRKLILIR